MFMLAYRSPEKALPAAILLLVFAIVLTAVVPAEAGVNVVSTTYEEIQVAAYAGRLDDVKQLLSEGVDINSKDKAGWTPLIAAASAGRKDVVSYLLENGADVNAQTKGGDTALIMVVWDGYGERLKNFLEEKLGRKAQQDESDTRAEIVCLLLEKGANKEIKNERGRTALYFAKLSEQTKTVELLE